MARDVKAVQFGVLGDDDVLAISACKIDQPNINAEYGGVYDPRLGSTKNNVQCPTCGRDVWKCSGHFGHIELATPVILFHKQVVVLLKCVCHECCRLLATETELKLNGVYGHDKTVAYLHSLSSCAHCKWPVPDVKFVSSDSAIVSTLRHKRDKVSKILEPSFVQLVFGSLPPADIRLLGLDERVVHPRNYVLTKFPVLPTCCRPKMCAGDNVCDDDLTILLVEMLKANAYITSTPKSVDRQAYVRAVETIRSRALAYCDNSRGKVTHNTNHKPMTGIKERINCKTGLVRQNLTGKRCDRTARTVIGPDSTLKLDEVAVPVEIARTLTVPERVTPLTLPKLTRIVNDGFAATIVRESGVKINAHFARVTRGTKLTHSDVVLRGKDEIPVMDCRMPLLSGDGIRRADGTIVTSVQLPAKKTIELKVGDVVERYLRDGDPLYFNRQPTLHRNSMLGMRVVVKPGKTFRFNLAITKELNADFDGDEGNIFCCSSLPAAAEMIHLVGVKEHVLSAQSQKPEHCFVQDSLLAAYLMTANPSPMSVADFETTLFRCSATTRRYERRTRRFAKDLFSYILPVDFNYRGPKLTIERGAIVSGYFDKTSLGSVSTAIVRLLALEYDKLVVADFIDNMQFLTNAWLELNPFSIGFDDCLVGDGAVLDDIKRTVSRFFIEASIAQRTVSNANIREAKVNVALNKAKDLGLKIAKDALTRDNKIVDTVTSGSKGDFFNIAQITGLLGQQNLNNKRPVPTLTNAARTLVHYPYVIVNDPDREYESRGFVKSSFLGGLNPKEMWFHAMTGREGMIATALKTASSGYIQRSCVKLNEDLTVAYDGTVRDASGCLYQFAYGNHGFDPSLLSGDGMPVDVSRLADKLCAGARSTRALTPTEISSLVEECALPRFIPDEIWTSIWAKHEKRLRDELRTIRLADDVVDEFRSIVRGKYAMARACPGECVGIIAAQSIGEIQTQSNLNTFHTAGKLQTSGVERFEEILKLTKSLKHPRMNVYFRERYESADELRRAVTCQFVGRTLKDVVSRYETLDIDATETLKSKIRFSFKKTALFAILLSPDVIMSALEETFADVSCECEPMAIVVNVAHPTVRSRSRAKRAPADDSSESTVVEEDGALKQSLNEDPLEALLNCQVCGIPRIRNMYVEATDDGEFFVTTDGSNLRRMLAHPLVDARRLYTNDVWETFDCLGIAATKRMILSDMKQCVTSVNDCHVRLLVEKMTYRGKPSPMTRYTMRSNNVGPLSKATFEQSVDVIQSAAFKGETDSLNGVSASIVTGSRARVGTGTMDLLIDLEKLEKNGESAYDDVYY